MGLEAADMRMLKWCVVTAVLAGFFVGGCAWQDTGNEVDSGWDGFVNGDLDDGYPPGPYGVNIGNTMANIRVYKCLCSSTGAGQGRSLDLDEYLGNKAVLISAHDANCTFCKQQVARMEPDFYDKYHEQGFDILLILFRDKNGNSHLQAVMDFCCEYKEDYGLDTFNVAGDPDMEVMRDYIREGTPLNILVDDEMTIRYRQEGYDPGLLTQNVEKLLEE
jgi:hypothetical protein